MEHRLGTASHRLGDIMTVVREDREIWRLEIELHTHDDIPRGRDEVEKTDQESTVD